MNHITMAKGHWRVYVCRYTEWYQCACDFVICENCYNKHNSTRSRQNNNMNTQWLQDMFSPLSNEHTGEVWCAENPLEYHKLQYLNMSDSAHIWIPSWWSKNGKNCRARKRSQTRNLFSWWLLQRLQKIWSSRKKIKNLKQKFDFALKFEFLIKFI